MYNHQKLTQLCHITEIDHFNIRFRNDILDEFRVSFNITRMMEHSMEVEQ